MDELKREYRIAGLMPAKIRLEVFLKNKPLLILTVASVLACFILGGYLFDGRQGTWIVLSFIAVGISIFGFFRTLTELARIDIENALINISRKQGIEYLESNETEELGRLFSILSKENESHPAVNRLIEHIVGEAKMSKFDSGINLIEPYKDESLDIIFSLQNFQKIALWIGIAGTFIGILKAMNDSNFKQVLEGGKAEDFVKIIPMMFDGLVVSFSASLAGLFSAVVIGCLVLIVRKNQQQYFQQLESVVNIVLSSARKCRNKDKFLSEIDFIRNDLEDSNRKIYGLEDKQTELKLLISELAQAAFNINLQNGKIENSLQSFLNSIDNIGIFAKKAENEMEHVYDAAALKSSLNTSIQSAGEKLSKNMSEAISDKLMLMTGEMINFREASMEYLVVFRKSVEDLQLNIKSQNSYLKTSREDNNNTIRSLNVNINSLAKTIQSLKLPQSLSTWVIVLALFSGLASGFSLFFGGSYLFFGAKEVAPQINEPKESVNSRPVNVSGNSTFVKNGSVSNINR